MANSTITNYLADPNIDADTRRKIANGLNSGDLDEATAVKGITAKYGTKYGTAETTVTTGTTNQSAKGLGSKIGSALGSLQGNLLNAAPKVATAVLKGAAAAGSKMSDEEVAKLNAQSTQHQKTLDTKNAARAADVEYLNSKGITPDANMTTEQIGELAKDLKVRSGDWITEPINKQISAGAKATAEAATQGVLKGAEGVQKVMASATGDTSQLEGFRAFYGLKSQEQAAEDMKQLSPGERGQMFGEGAQNFVSGTIGASMAPLSGAVEAVPYGKEAMGAFGEHIINPVVQEGSKQLKDKFKSFGIQLTPEQEASIDEGVGNIANLLMMKSGEDAAKVTQLETLKAGLQKQIPELIQKGDIAGAKALIAKYEQANLVPTTATGRMTVAAGEGAKALATSVVQGVGEGAVQIIKNVGKTPKAVGEVVSRFQEKPTGKVTTDLINAGVGEQHANILENKPHLTGTAAQYVERGIKNLKDMANRESTFEAPAKEISRSRDIAKKQLREVGKNMGKFMEEDLQGKNVSVSPIASAIDDVKTKLNIDKYADIGTEEAFSASDILKDSDIAKGLQEISKKIKSTRSYKGDLTSTISGLNADGRAVIGIKRTINDIIKSSKNKAEVRAVFDPIIDAAENIIKENSSRYSTASSEYASLKQAIDNIDKAGGVTLSGGKKGFSAQQILKRSLKEGSPIYRDAIEALQKLEDEFGIEAPKDILEKAVLADMAEKITRSAPTKSTEAILPRPTGKLGIAVDAYQKAKRALKPTKEIEAKAQIILNILKGDQKVPEFKIPINTVPIKPANIPTKTLEKIPQMRFNKNMGDSVLINEAKKYKSADEFIRSITDDKIELAPEGAERLKSTNPLDIKEFLEKRGYYVVPEEAKTTNSSYFKISDFKDRYKQPIRFSDHRNESVFKAGAKTPDELNIVKDKYFDENATIKAIEKSYPPVVKSNTYYPGRINKYFDYVDVIELSEKLINDKYPQYARYTSDITNKYGYNTTTKSPYDAVKYRIEYKNMQDLSRIEEIDSYKSKTTRDKYRTEKETLKKNIENRDSLLKSNELKSLNADIEELRKYHKDKSIKEVSKVPIYDFIADNNITKQQLIDIYNEANSMGTKQ